MRELFRMDLKDYDINLKRFRRPSVRGIIIKDNDEDVISALKREVLEETGLTVIDSSVMEYGSVLRIQKSRVTENEIFEQENFYYLCQTENSVISQELDDYELDEGFELQYVYPEHAILVNCTHSHDIYDLILIERESKVLECLIKEKLI